MTLFNMLGQIGVAVWMFLIMCIVSLVAAGRFAWAGPKAPRLPVVIGLGAATFFATGAVVAKGLVMALGGYGRLGKGEAAPHPRALEQLVVGSAEALSGGVLGCATLTLIALLVVVGYRRRARPELTS